MANIANNTWRTSRQTTTINVTADSGAVDFDMGIKLTDEMCCAKACVTIDASKYKTVTLKYELSKSDGISSLYFGVFDNMTARYSGGITSDSSSGLGVTQITASTSKTITIDIPSGTTGTKYVGFLFYGNTYSLNENVGWSVRKKVTITSLTAVERGYTLTYNANGGSGAPSSVSNVTSTTISSTVPTRTGHDFLGWSKSSTATSQSYKAGDSISLSSDTTLYAVWKKKTYVVSYDANGGSGAPSNQTKTYGETLILSSTKPTKPNGSRTVNGSFKITGDANGGYFAEGITTDTITSTTTRIDIVQYPFDKWNTAQDGSGTDYNAGSGYTDNSEVKLYAQYSYSTITGNTSYTNNNISALKTPSRDNSVVEQYIINFDTNGGSGNYGASSIKFREYTFEGWATSASATSANASETYTAKTTVYAYWTYKDSTTSITLPTPTRNGYTFEGWATSADAEIADIGVGTYEPSADITLYAIWKPMGLVYIYDNLKEFSPYEIFIYDGSGWNQYIPYIYTESGWELYSG